MVFERLRSIVAEQFAVSEDSITMDTSFVDDLGADSLDAVDLIMAIEEQFDFTETDELPDTLRGAGGFGHTGV